jgi:hypothetical protein
MALGIHPREAWAYIKARRRQLRPKKFERRRNQRLAQLPVLQAGQERLPAEVWKRIFRKDIAREEGQTDPAVSD